MESAKGGLRGDQGVQNGHGDDTRDPVSSSSASLSIEARALIAQWREKADEQEQKRADWAGSYRGGPVAATHHARMTVFTACADDLTALLRRHHEPETTKS